MGKEYKEIDLLIAGKIPELRRKALLRKNIKGAIDAYLLIKDKYEKHCLDDEFKKKYKWFYRLNAAGLGEEIKRKNFEYIKRGETNLEKILSELYKIPTIKGQHKIHFSFATKIIHTIDNSKPIYDRNVAEILGLQEALDSRHPKEARINRCLAIYSELQQKTNYLLESPLGQGLIREFYKIGIPNIDKIDKPKALDFCLWLLGSKTKIECTCDEKACGKCLFSNCTDDYCATHTIDEKIKRKKIFLKQKRDAFERTRLDADIERLSNLR